MKKSLESDQSKEALFQALVDFGNEQILQSHAKNLSMAKIGVEELKKILGDRKWNLMTHCNTGFLACGSLGDCLGRNFSCSLIREGWTRLCR
jgi:methylthioribose-1-phosphate isomerase